MRTLLLVCLAFSISTSSIFADHGGTIKGIVVSAADNSILTGVSVQLKELKLYTATNEIGLFVFPDLPDGEYMLEVRQLGYATQEKRVKVSNHETANIKIALEESALKLDDVEIRANTQNPGQALSQLDIQLRPVQSAQDILRMVPGLFIAQHAGGGKAEQIFLRGFDIDHGTDIALFADGMPVNMVSHAHGQGYADLHFLIPELVQKVDFQKGPYAAQTGNFATAGEAHFQTPLTLDENFIKLEGGQFDTYRLSTAMDLLGGSTAANGTRAYVAGEQLYSNAYFDAPQHFRRGNYFAKLSKIQEQKQSFSLSLSHFTSSWTASGQIPDRAVRQGQISRFGAIDATEGGLTSRSNANLIHNYLISDKSWIRNQLYYSRYAFELYSNFTFFLEDSINGDQIRQKERRELTGYQSTFHYNDRLWGKGFQFKAGLQLRLDEVDDNELSHTRNRRETLNSIALGDLLEINGGLFAEAELQLAPTLRLGIGGRFDQFYYNYQNALDSAFTVKSASRNILSPKFNLSWQAHKKVQLFLRTGSGFHSNDTRVVGFASDKDILPRALGLDLGLNLQPLPGLFLQLIGWQLDLEQEFVYVGDAGIVEPGGETRRHGLDLSLRWQLLPKLFLDGDYTWTKARAVGEAAYHIPLAPVHTATGGLSYQTPGIQASVRARFLGDRPANEDYSLSAKGYFLLDAQLCFRPAFGQGKRPLEFTLSAQNIGNVDWNEAQFETSSRLRNELEPVTEIHFTPGTPFVLKAGMTFRF